MRSDFLDSISAILAEIDEAGLRKREREIEGPQGAHIAVGGRTMLNFCANNYLGLANNPEIRRAAAAALDSHGFGMASVRFICGTQDLHRALERRIAAYLGKDDAILFAACFDANGALFETILGSEDAVISDSLNHASIIDGVRLSKARRYRYATSDMDALEAQLQQADADKCRFKLIITDGVFSMDGHVARLEDICALAERYGAIVAVDECHATGHLGAGGRGTPALTGVEDRVDIITGTLGKTLGGAMGGFIAAAQPIIDLLRQRARPYLFSNSLAPSIAAGSLKAIDIAETADDLRARLVSNTRKFRAGLAAAGFSLIEGRTPIIPVMLGDAVLAQRMTAALDQRDIYVAGFSYPVVPHGLARIRTQMSAELTDRDIDLALAAFADAGREVGVIG
ncbi:MAG: glycine C-acetyltransferase [Pelagibacterium sp. SCN 63-23]|nr:MAG: glycine C-acetyltransferase [Pelagibacterium sp. SCN 63-23]